MGKLVLVTGGVKSGKSDFAESLCLKNSGKMAYIATATIFDDEILKKVEQHKKKRSPYGWETIEEYKNLHKIIKKETFKYDTILIDCATLLVNNLIFEQNKIFDASDTYENEVLKIKIFEEIQQIINAIKHYPGYFVIVTNEIGLGGIAENKLSRFFANTAGKVNQMLAKQSDEVYLLVSGIDVKIK